LGYLTVLTGVGPVIITQQPTNLSLYPGQMAQFAAVTLGATSYQWWFTNLSTVGVKLSDGGTISGSLSNVLTISSVSNNNAGTYMVVLSNSVGSVTSSIVTLNVLPTSGPSNITMSVVETAGQDWNTGTNWSDLNPASLSVYSEPGSTYTVLSGAALRTPAGAPSSAFPAATPLIITNGGGLILEHSAGAGSIAVTNLQLIGGVMDNGADGLATLTGQMAVTNSVTIYTDTNQPAGLIINFDVAGGVGSTNYNGFGAYPDAAGHTYWNPVTGITGTTPAGTNSDGATVSTVTLTVNASGFNNGDYSPYGSHNNFTNNIAGTLTNTPVALVGSYLYVGNTFTPGPAINTITNTLNNVPAGTYNIYVYGNNGGNAGGPGGNGQQNDQGTVFTVSSDTTSATSLMTTNQTASLTSNTLIQGADYVVFSNVVNSTSGGTITVSWTANTAVSSLDYAGPNSQGVFNGLQLVSVVAAAAGPRPTAINSLLTGSGTINYDAGDTNFASDLDIAGTGNTFSGQWNVMQGALLGGAAGSLGTNTITVGTNGALETLYGINDTNAGLVLNGKMFLHTSDTFKTLTINTNIVNAGTYSFSQLNTAYPANFPAGWPMQTNSTVNTGSGQITVLSPVVVSSSTNTTLVVLHSGSNLILSWTNNANSTLQTSTNLLSAWTPVVGATSPYTNNILTNGPIRFYRVHP
jgi:hypothetical protein